MKTILFKTSRPIFRGISEIKILLVSLLLIGIASCAKQDGKELTNIPSGRSDISQAQVLESYDLAKGAVLNDRVDGVDYLILANVKVTSGRLTIKPGVTVMFENGAGIEISEGGSLTAIGEAGNEIYFISKSGKRGDWQGITVLSNSAANVISYCHLEHGGSSLNAYGQANITVGSSTQPASVEISHNTISTSAGVGILINDGSGVTGFTGNTITSNTTYPVSVNIAYARNLQGSNTYNNNGKEYIELTGSGENMVVTPSVIHNLNEPYALTGNITMGTNLTIDAGVPIYMNSGAQLNIDGQSGAGSLTAVGTASQPITWTGVFSESGLWNSINFKSAYSALNHLEYCQITGGGALAEGNHGMINFESAGEKQSQIILRNCSISNSATKGVYIQKNTIYNSDIETSNSFTNNAGGNIYFDIH